MAADQGYWNGLPTPVRKVTGVVPAHDPDKHPPQAWWAGIDPPQEVLDALGIKSLAENLQGQRVEAVEVVLDGVNYGGGIVYLDNRDGSGWRKVTEGRGSPRYADRSFPLEDVRPLDSGLDIAPSPAHHNGSEAPR